MPVFLTPEWWSALAAIVVIDLVLAGDNAIVIGLAARNVPAHLQQPRHPVGHVRAPSACASRSPASSSGCCEIPGFLVVGGLALVWIGWRLTRGGGGAHEIKAATSVRGAIQTIVVADAVMGIDNVLAIGGAAQGSSAAGADRARDLDPDRRLGLDARRPLGRSLSGDPLGRGRGARLDRGEDDRQRAADRALDRGACRSADAALRAHRRRTGRRPALAVAVPATARAGLGAGRDGRVARRSGAGSKTGWARNSTSSTAGAGTTSSSTSCAGSAGSRFRSGCTDASPRRSHASDRRSISPSACAKSAIRSSRSSMPTEMRISESAMPIAARRSGPISQKIVCATGIASVRLSPRFDDETTICRRFRKSKQSMPLASSNARSPPKPRKSSRASACCGCAARPG